MENKKLMQCKTCGAEMASSAKVCPKCGAKNKQPIYKRPWFIVLVVIIVLAMLSGGSDKPTSSGTTPSNNESTISDTTNNSSEEAKSLFAQDEVVTYKDVDYAITNVEKTMGGEFDHPKDGKEFIVVTLSIKNNSDQVISYSTMDWKMENSNGQVESETYSLWGTDTALHTGELKSGGFVEGTVVFEEPIGDEGLKLNYYDNIFEKTETFQFIID